MAARELHVLGTASQAPSRRRNHNGYFLRWDGEGLLFDPGEGTQRQLLLAGIAASSITRILVTHFHGDHCLGMPGILQRLALDRVSHPVDVYFPASGAAYFERLRHASIYQEAVALRVHAVEEEGLVDAAGGMRILAGQLDHRVDTLGWRVEEPDGRRILPGRLADLGVQGPDIGRLQRAGQLMVGDREVNLEEVSEHRPGQSFAFVMDTRPCAGARRLAQGVDLLVSESTFLDRDRELAQAYGHLTAAQAGQLAAEGAARSLLLTHFSQRYQDELVFEREASATFPGARAAIDLDTVPLPGRR